MPCYWRPFEEGLEEPRQEEVRRKLNFNDDSLDFFADNLSPNLFEDRLYNESSIASTQQQYDSKYRSEGLSSASSGCFGYLNKFQLPDVYYDSFLL